MAILNPQTLQFVRRHQDDDVRQLALRGTKDPAVDLTLALQQIAGRQTARRKLPSWAAAEDIVYPPHLNMEQCSSEQTARYKAALVDSLTAESVNGKSVNSKSVNSKSVNSKSVNSKSVNSKSVNSKFVDLTGGFGVDFYWMSRGFRQRIYVEQSEALCLLAEHNFKALAHDCSVCCCTTATFLPTIDHADVIFLDPARRDEHGGRTYGIADCTPNVLELLPLLLTKSDYVVLKLSPMLDWRKACRDLRCVSQVHIVSVGGECKELLLVLCAQPSPTLRLICASDGSTFETRCELPAGDTTASQAEAVPASQADAVPASQADAAPTCLLEPNASVMKAGCFDELERRFGIAQIAPNSHLFLAPEDVADFPGRRFSISAATPMNKGLLRRAMAGIKQANIAVRNFPLTAAELRKKLRLKDGGDIYIFATTTRDGCHKLFICRKIG